MKMMGQKKRFGLVIFFTIVGLSIVAQDFEISPVKLNFNAEPGQTQTIPINIVNHSNAKTSFTINLGDYVLNKEGKKIGMPAASTEHSLVNWMSINPPFLELNPNEERQVLVSIQAPSGDFSTRWANIFIRTSKEQTALMADKDVQTGLMLYGQIVVNAIQSPKSNINYKMKIANIQEIINIQDSVRTFSANIDNLGDKVATCKVVLLASNINTAKETKLDEIKFESYPDSQLKIKLKMNKALPPGKYALAAILDYGNKSNLEGTQMLIEVK